MPRTELSFFLNLSINKIQFAQKAQRTRFNQNNSWAKSRTISVHYATIIHRSALIPSPVPSILIWNLNHKVSRCETNLVCVVHSQTATTTREVKDFVRGLLAAISRSEYNFKLSRFVDNKVCSSVLQRNKKKIVTKEVIFKNRTLHRYRRPS